MPPATIARNTRHRAVTIPSRRPAGDLLFDGYFSAPESGAGAAILLLPEMFGLTEAMKRSADAFAAAGYATLMPNLFWRDAPPGVLAYEGEERQASWNRLQAFDRGRSLQDMADAVAWLRAEAGAGLPVVAVGHCIGGRLAVLAAAQLGLAGASSFYGLGLSGDAEAFLRLRAPVQLHYGLADEHVPAEEIDAVTAITRDNPRVRVFLYPGAGHSFCNPMRPLYAPGPAALVMERTLALVEAAATAR